MTQTRKARIPSAAYLKQKIEQIGAIANPTRDEALLLAQYKKLIEQRVAMDNNCSQHRVHSTENMQTAC